MLTMMLVKNTISLLNTTIAPMRNMMNVFDNLPMILILWRSWIFDYFNIIINRYCADGRTTAEYRREQRRRRRTEPRQAGALTVTGSVSNVDHALHFSPLPPRCCRRYKRYFCYYYIVILFYCTLGINIYSEART